MTLGGRKVTCCALFLLFQWKRSMANDRRRAHPDIWAIIPVKEASLAKQRLADALSPRRCGKIWRSPCSRTSLRAVGRRRRTLQGIAVVTADPTVAAIARRAGAEDLDRRRA